MGDFAAVWSELLKIFPILNGEVVYPLQEVEKDVYEDVYRHLNGLGSIETFTAILDLEVESTVRNILAPTFWKQLSSNGEPKATLDQALTIAEITAKDGLFCKFIDAVNKLYDGYRCLLEMKPRLTQLNKCEASSSNVENIKSTLRNALLARLPPTFNNFISDFYCVHYRLFTKDSILSSTTIDSEVFTELPCPGCNYDHDQCCCQKLTEMVNSTNLKLLEMGLIDRLAGSALTALIKLKIKEHINDTCLGIFDRSHLKQLETWINDVVMTWLTSIFTEWRSSDDINREEIPETVTAFKVKLTYFMYETFAQNVISQFFSIIIYPDSTPAIEDLKICMEKIDMRIHLTESLRSALEARILHPGVNTMDILTGYVAAIKAIRHLDNTGVILEIVTAPIKDYLRKRNDTVRRVVTGLTEEGPTDLSEELAKGEFIKDGKDAGLNEFSNWENWEPDPFGIDPDVLQVNNSKIIRSADIISMVVDIYGSKELFMVEYRNLMADRLLSQLDFNSEKEIRNLELLKIRFGESLLHSCEVMLKDVTDSKRINAHIHGDGNINESMSTYISSNTKTISNLHLFYLGPLFDISSLIISAQFWPSFNKESLQLPEELENEFKKFTKAYESYKGNRTLNWRTVTGRVNIVIEIGERVMEMTVPPTQAVIIYHFQHKSEWALDELSSLIKVPPSALRRRISFWQNHGLITETEPGVFSLLEEESEKIEFEEMNITDADEEDLESAMASASDQREEELQVFWSYIVGMLTNLDSMPIDRIHQMLKLFASNGGGVEFTQDELKHFLQRKVREHKLLFSGGVYQLAK
ncbi:hypothetical protein KR044_006022 [Drosophila immigrans]|nr:hypothetical protein KR044_006022 [Drosophila immigrans]